MDRPSTSRIWSLCACALAAQGEGLLHPPGPARLPTKVASTVDRGTVDLDELQGRRNGRRCPGLEDSKCDELLNRELRIYEGGSIHQQKPKTREPSRYTQPVELIGNTPLVDVTAVCEPLHPDTVVLAKLEVQNPGLSIKDRVVLNIFNTAEAEGRLREGATVVAASSGNTGCSVAMLCAIRGYRAVVITNEKCSKEKCDAITAYGAELLIVPPGECYMQKEHDLASEHPDWFSVDQYENRHNPAAHYKSVGPEIWRQTAGDVTHFVAAGSTGGTITGTGAYLKERNPGVQVVLADPTGSVFSEYFKTGVCGAGKPFLVEGVGKANIPGAMDMAVVDAVVDVDDQDAFAMCRRLSRKTGLCIGGSAGLNVEAAARLAEASPEPLTIVTVLADSGVKYLSKVYNDEYLAENGIDANLDKREQPKPTSRQARLGGAGGFFGRC